MIQRCKYRASAAIYPIHRGQVLEAMNATEKYVYKGDLLIVDLKTYESDDLEFYLDQDCVTDSSPDQAKWAFIYNLIYKNMDAENSSGTSLWIPIGNNPAIPNLNIENNYKIGNSLSITYTPTSYFMGFKQRVVVFDSEESLNDPFYFYIIPIGEPEIGFASFRNSHVLRKYGEAVTVEMLFHNYPQFSYAIEEKYKAKVYVFDKEEGVGLLHTKDLEAKNLLESAYEFDLVLPNYLDKDHINVYHEYTFLVDSSWRGDEKREKEYSIVVELYRKKGKNLLSNVHEMLGTDYELIATRNYMNEPGGNLRIYDANDNTIKEVPNSISSFRVGWDTVGDILESREVNTQNMIAYVGDLDYSINEFDPCAYTKITVQSGSEDPVVLFDEYENLDNTQKMKFGIITGEGTDYRKSVIVTAGFQQSKDGALNGIQLAPKVPCHQILNNKKDHASVEDVFKMGYIIGQWRPPFLLQILNSAWRIVDPTTPKLQKGKENTASPYSAQTVAEVQGLATTDYEYLDNGIALQLQYRYNQTILDGTVVHNQVTDGLWVFRYFVLSDRMAQTYFVPVTTCRYPNQVAQISVYPDIQWELAALVSVPLTRKVNYKFESSREDLSGFYKQYEFKYINEDLSIKTETTERVGANFKLKATTFDETFELSYKIEKSIKKVVATFNQVYEQIQVFDGTKKNVKESAAYKKGVLNKFEFAIDPPNVAIALKWKYALPKSPATAGQVGWQMEGGAALKPFMGIGITVDLLTVLGNMGLVGTAAKWIVLALKNTINELDVYFHFKLQAEIAAGISIRYHSIDGWDDRAKREVTFTVRATIEAGVKYEDKTVIAKIIGIRKDEEVVKIDINGSLGAGIEYKEVWDSDDKGIFKSVTVNFLGCTASFYVYAMVTKRKKGVPQGESDSFDKQLGNKFDRKLMEPATWCGSEKTYTYDA